MAETFARETAERLIQSAAWASYCQAKLLPLYSQVSAMLDETKDDHRYLQGLKHGLRMALSMPYEAAQQPGPLEADWRRRWNQTPAEIALQQTPESLEAMQAVRTRPPQSHLA